MYDYIDGEIVEKGPTSVVLESHGVGYRCTVSLNSSDRFCLGERARAFTHLHVRENEHRLYGFHSTEERSLFQLLLTVSGVGPSLAIKLLSGCPHGELRRHIVDADVDRLRSIRGVGTKTAQRIVVDLKDAVRAVGADEPEEAAAATQAAAWEDALLALVTLGYRRPAAEKALRRALEEAPPDRPVQDLVRLSLRFL